MVCVIPGLSQSVHRHPAGSSFDFQPDKNHDSEPEVTLQSTWNNLVVKKTTTKRNNTTTKQNKKIGGFVAFHLDRHINYNTLHKQTGSPQPKKLTD